MGAINTSRSNIKNTFRTAGGKGVTIEVNTETTEKDGQVTAQAVVIFQFDDQNERHEFRAEGSRPKK